MESSSSSSCVVCSIQVGFFRGKKKCRICNEVVCRKCSSSDHYSEFYRNFITLCAHCKSKAEELSKRSELDRESPPEKVYYKTRSICAKCFLLDNPGTLSYRDGKVFQRDGKVLLEVKCDKHGTWTTLLSSDVDLFERIWRTGNSSDSKINDVEDLVDSPESPKVSPKKTNPLFVEVDLWNNKSQVFVDDAEVIAKIETLTSWKRHNSDRSDHFVLKLNGGALATRKLLKDFNAKILSLEKRLPSGPILLELPFDRLSDLCILDDSVLIKGRMFPCVRYFLKYGEEAVFKREISHLVNSLRLYPTIQLTMILAVDEPYPCFAPVLEFLKNHKRMARCLIISRQRSTRAIFDNLSKLAEPEDSNAVTELDPYGNDIARLLRQIQEDSNGSIRVQDFSSLALAKGMSPVLQLFGYGKFTIDPSPFCVLGSAFINSPKHSFLPLNQFLEADRFLLDVNRSIFQKFFRRENSSRENSFPIWLQVRILRLMQKILQDSIRKEYRSETPILSSYVSPSASESSKMKFEEFCREIQFIFIHNYMDLAAVDMHRRHQCINIRSSLVNSSASAAVCTGCL